MINSRMCILTHEHFNTHVKSEFMKNYMVISE